MDNKYINSVVYKIYCKDENITDIYVGSTTNFKRRCREHINTCYNINKKHYNIKLYKFIRENDGFDNFIFEIIKKFTCENKTELLKEEDKYIVELNSTLNCFRASRNQKQRDIDNKEKRKQYNEDNKEKIAEQRKQYYEKNKQQVLEKKKQYYEDNKEKVLEKNKQYRQDNAEKIKEQEKIKIICPCGSHFRLCDKVRHMRSQKHQTYDFLNSIETKYSKMFTTEPIWPMQKA